MDISTPIGRNKIEIRKPRLSLKYNTTDVGKSTNEDLRRNRVTIAYEYMRSSPFLRVVPILTNQRNGIPVFMTLDVYKN